MHIEYINNTAHDLAEFAEQNALILTPNNRLAVHLQEVLLEALTECCGTEKAKTLELPLIAGFHRFFSEIYSRLLLLGLTPNAQILSPNEENYFWKTIIHNELQHEVLSQALLIEEARKASHLSDAWQIDITDHAFTFSSVKDSQSFLNWKKQFDRQIQERNFITSTQALNVCLHAKDNIFRKLINQYNNASGSRVSLFGFLTLSPLEAALYKKINNLDQKGEEVGESRVYTFSQHREKKNQSTLEKPLIQIAACHHFREEIQQAALWAKTIREKQPFANIGIVVNDLVNNKLLVEETFLNVFEPDALKLGQETTASKINISVGMPLSKTPLVSIYLQLLSASLKNLSLDEWQLLLASPYWMENAKNSLLGNQILQAMYDSAEKDFGLLDLPRLLHWHKSLLKNKINNNVNDEQEKTGDDQWYSALNILLDKNKFDFFGNPQIERKPSEWFFQFHQLLLHLGWPGTKTQSSDEYQQAQQFEDARNSILKLDKLIKSVKVKEAFSLFEQHLKYTVYHRQTVFSDQYKPVNVLGVLEAGGQKFDYLWLSGISDRSWPSQPLPNALLPYSLQVEMEMPASSEQKEFSYAKNQLMQFLQGAEHAVVSYSQITDDTESNLSPLVSLVAKQQGFELADYKKAELMIDKEVLTIEIERIDDRSGLSYPKDNNEITRLSGGSYFLQAYKDSPFFAYLKYRLGIEPLQKPDEGISPLERGLCLHGVMEKIGNTLNEKEAILKKEDKELKKIVSNSVSEVLNTVIKKRFRPHSRLLLDIEKNTLNNICYHWLSLEKQRPDFSIASTEKKFSIQFNNYKVNGRVDRIDQLSNGASLIIDYKSGAVKSIVVDEQLDNIQLSLYALMLYQSDILNKDEKIAIAYACLKPGMLGLKGTAFFEDETGINGMSSFFAKPDTDISTQKQLFDAWTSAISELIIQIDKGYAALNLTAKEIKQVVTSNDPYLPLARFYALSKEELDAG